MKKFILIGIIVFCCISASAQNTWSRNVAQLVYDNCSPCHNPKGIAPFSLLTYTDAKSNDFRIKSAVSQKTMPPWIANSDYQTYAHQRVLTNSEVQIISSWVDDGAPEGVASETPPPPLYSTEGYINQTPDLEVKLPQYRSKATSKADDYVCFSVPSGLTANKRIRAFEVIPGNHNVVHHALLYIDASGKYPTDTSAGVCTGPTTGLIGGYVPGSPPTIFPSDGANFNLGFEIKSGSNIVLAMHYPEGSFGELDSTKVRFWFYDDAKPVRQITTASLIENWSFVLPAGKETKVNASYTNSVGEFSLLSVFPHMHLLGHQIKAYGIDPNKDTIRMVEIPHWDFEWQEFLFFDRMKKITKGTTIFGEGTYDNTIFNEHNPNNPPITVYPGLNTKDEMFLIYFHFLAYQDGDENIDIQALTSLSSEKFYRNSQLSVYPNPAKHQVQFQLLEDNYVSAKLRIYNTQGQLVDEVENVERETLGSKITWMIPEHLSSGLYHYSLNVDGKFLSGSVYVNP